jgi:predicted dehydrogenase
MTMRMGRAAYGRPRRDRRTVAYASLRPMATRTSVGIGVIGAGHWGPNLIRLLSNTRHARVIAVADADEARLVKVQERFPEVRTTATPDDVFAADDIDAVVVVTPTSTHEAIVRGALECRKHVFVEKPITNSAESALRLCELAERLGLLLMVGHVFLYNSAVLRAKEYLDDGALGRIYYIAMARTNLGPIRADVNVSWDLAAHDISIANYWLDAQPLSASAVSGTWINPGVADTVFATLRYPDDVIVNLQSSWLHPRKVREVAVVGENQMLTLDDLSLTEPIRLYDKRVSDEVTSAQWVDSFASFRASVREGDIVIPKVAMQEPLAEECEHFVECVLDGSTPRTSGRDGLAVVRALEAIDQSMSLGGAECQVHGSEVAQTHA